MTEQTCPECRNFMKKSYLLFLACFMVGAFASIIYYTHEAASIDARNNITSMYNQCQVELVACKNPRYPWAPNMTIINASIRPRDSVVK